MDSYISKIGTKSNSISSYNSSYGFVNDDSFGYVCHVKTYWMFSSNKFKTAYSEKYPNVNGVTFTLGVSYKTSNSSYTFLNYASSVSYKVVSNSTNVPTETNGWSSGTISSLDGLVTTTCSSLKSSWTANNVYIFVDFTFDVQNSTNFNTILSNEFNTSPFLSATASVEVTYA